MSTVRIGTRASTLALVQAEAVAAAIRAQAPGLEVQLVKMTTTGDKILDRPLDAIGGKGLFVKELDAALLDGRVDIVVHSSKDLPMQLAEGTRLVAAGQRADAHDVLVLPQGCTEWDRSEPVGCSSARRRVQLRLLDAQLDVQSVRGNVQTRLAKLDGGQYGALVLAAAGLERLGLRERASRSFSFDEMYPAAGQGILAVTAREGESAPYLAGFASEEGLRCLRAERAFVRALDGGCSSPCAAFAQPREDGSLHLRGMYVSDDESIVRRQETVLGPDGFEEQAMRFALSLKEG